MPYRPVRLPIAAEHEPAAAQIRLTPLLSAPRPNVLGAPLCLFPRCPNTGGLRDHLSQRIRNSAHPSQFR